MATMLRKGTELSKSKLKHIIKEIGGNYKTVISNYFEYIPDGEWTDDQKLAFIICAIPSVGDYPVRLIVVQLIKGPTVFNDPSWPGTKPNMLRALKSVYPDTFKACVNMYREHKYVPEQVKSNDDWCFLCWLAQLIDRCASEWPANGVPTVEQLNGFCFKCLTESAKFYATHSYI